ncbi:hypothetical protein [Singulisphaera sp. PoT]|uniref:hypothetical protein n=1 Tax=Singulisphaera sp. PoT TaxID=3411797 RepID=UPI003BF5F694
MSQPTIDDVQAAVRSVLLGLNGSARQVHKPRPIDIFAERLLSLRQAELLPRELREVRVAPGTVVTPLARDFLKRHAIELRWVSRGEVETIRNRGEWGFASDVQSGVVTAFRRLLLEDTFPWFELKPEPRELAQWLGESPGRGALVLTNDAPVIVWRGCRFPSVRAASAVDVEGVAKATRSLGVNLLAVEPAGKSIPLLKQMSLTFRRPGAPEAPDDLFLGDEP